MVRPSISPPPCKEACAARINDRNTRHRPVDQAGSVGMALSHRSRRRSSRLSSDAAWPGNSRIHRRIGRRPSAWPRPCGDGNADRQSRNGVQAAWSWRTISLLLEPSAPHSLVPPSGWKAKYDAPISRKICRPCSALPQEQDIPSRLIRRRGRDQVSVAPGCRLKLGRPDRPSILGRTLPKSAKTSARHSTCRSLRTAQEWSTSPPITHVNPVLILIIIVL